MAKKSAALKVAESSVPSIDRDLLAKIATGQLSQVNRDQAYAAGLQHQPPLIEVGAVDVVTGFAPVRIIEAGTEYLTAHVSPLKESHTMEIVKKEFAIIAGAALPPSKRGSGLGGGAPVKYPFDTLEVGASFFVPVSAKLENPVKTLGSTVSSANMRYAVETGPTKIVSRAKRGKGNKLELDDQGHKIMETKTVPVYNFTRKFEIRGVEAGKVYGDWTAPTDGALIQRTK